MPVVKLPPKAQSTESLPTPSMISKTPRTTEPLSTATIPCKTTLATEMPVWQTTTVKAQKLGNGRHYAMKQVDAFVPTSSQQVQASVKPTTSFSANIPSVEAIRNGSERVPQYFLPTLGVASSKVFISSNARHATESSYGAVERDSARTPRSFLPAFEADASVDSNAARIAYDSAPSGCLTMDSSSRTNVNNASNTAIFKERRKHASAALTGDDQPASTSRPKVAKRSAIKKVTDSDVTQGMSPIVVSQHTQVGLTCR